MMRSFELTALIASACLLILLLPAGIEAQGSQEDTDSDGLPDYWEVQYGLNETDPSDAELDKDLDGLNNTLEYEIGTDPTTGDTDDDGMPDGWEYENNLYPTIPSADNDEDGDGYSDLEEYQREWDPQNRTYPDIEPGGGGINDPSEEEEDAGAVAAFTCIPLFIIAVGIIIFLIIIGIYSKIRKDRLLDHETRQKIFNFIKENPGTYYSQIRKELSLAHGVVTHHLNMMETQELVFSKQDRQFRRFYVGGLYKDAPMVTGVQKKVLDEIRRYPGLSQKQISEHLDLYPMLVSYHVGQLEDLDLVEKKKEGRKNLLFAKTKSKEERIVDEVLGRGPFEGPAPEMAIAEN